MFSFHKPKVYRSTTGCCICKAKSSSSRFTDSKKYEDDFIECFLLQERRAGEICNACVLLVKRWKKLPEGSNRHWNHVVDARAGPGIKSMTKFKSKKNKKSKDLPEKLDKVVKKKHVYIKNRDREESPAMCDDFNGVLEYETVEARSRSSSRSRSPAFDISVSKKRVGREKHKLGLNFFMDNDYFTREETCCGVIYRGLFGEAMAELGLMQPCAIRSAPMSPSDAVPSETCYGFSPPSLPEKPDQEKLIEQQQQPQSADSSASTSPANSASTSPAHSVESNNETVVNPTEPAKTFSEGQDSSDSGYEESSNQFLAESKAQLVSSKIPLKVNPKKRALEVISSAEAKRLKIEEPTEPLDEIACSPISLAASSVVATLQPVPSNQVNTLADLALHASSMQSLGH